MDPPLTINQQPSAINNRFTLAFYFQALTRLLSSPSRFFSELSQETGLSQPMGFLITSALFSAGAGVTTLQDRRLLMAGIWMLNAAVMPVILAGISFMVMTMSMGKRASFQRLLSIYAYASGVTLLASWIPLLVWITEPWKWCLVVIGMVKACGLKWIHTVLIAAASILILVLLLWSICPIITSLKSP